MKSSWSDVVLAKQCTGPNTLFCR